MIRSALPVLSVFLLTAAAPPGAGQVQPGRWQYAVTILDAQMPGMPAGAMRGRTNTLSACVTPAEAAGGPRSVFERSGGRCRFTSFNQTGTQVTGTMTCAGGMTMTSTGTYSMTVIDVSGRMTGPNGMRMTTRTVGRRVGAC